MPIKFTSGNILNDKSEALVNPVNAIGVSGKGLALEFKKKFPGMFKSYQEACAKGIVQLGKIFMYETDSLEHPKFIICFPTKGHWKDSSNLENIRQGLTHLKLIIDSYNITSIALPKLGCGLGKLSWKTVRPIILEELNDSKSEIIIYV